MINQPYLFSYTILEAQNHLLLTLARSFCAASPNSRQRQLAVCVQFSNSVVICLPLATVLTRSSFFIYFFRSATIGEKPALTHLWGKQFSSGHPSFSFGFFFSFSLKIFRNLGRKVTTWEIRSAVCGLTRISLSS